MRSPLLYLFLLSTLGLAYAALGLRFNADIERLFPDDDPELTYFQSFREEFSNENDYLGIALQSDSGIFHSAFLQQVDSLGKRLSTLPWVEKVSGLTRDSFLRIGPLGTRLERPLLRPDRTQGYAADSAFLLSLPLFPQIYLSEDARSTCLYLKVPNTIAYGPQGDTLLARVAQELGKFHFDASYLTGGFYAHKVQGNQLREELIRLTSAALLLTVLAFAWAFRSVKMVLLPVLIIGAAVIWTLGAMALSGGELNLMTVLVPPLLFIVGSSDIIHLSARYKEALLGGEDQEAAIGIALKEVGWANLLTSVTTAIGFLTLAGVGVAPVRQLGLYGALGVMLTFGLTVFLLPGMLRVLTPAWAQKPTAEYGFADRLFRTVRQHRKWVSALGIGLLLLSFAGMSRLKVQAYFTEELPDTGQEMTFFERHYGGLRPFALGVSVIDPRYAVFDPVILRQMDRLDTYLREVYGVNRMATLVNYFKSAHCSLYNGDPAAFILPQSDAALVELVEGAREYGETHGVFDDWVSEDGKTARVAGALHDLGLQAWQHRNAELSAFVARELDTSLVKVQLTGAAHLIDRSHRMISWNMLAGLGLAVGVVALLMGVLYRSWRILLIALLVNLWPLALIAGVLGIAGIGLKISTSIIFTLAFGIAVDDTLHFLSRLRLEQRKGPDALRQTFRSTGTAILLTSLILAAGFGVLGFSAFPGTRLTGMLLGLGLILALVADLLWLPALLEEEL